MQLFRLRKAERAAKAAGGVDLKAHAANLAAGAGHLAPVEVSAATEQAIADQGMTADTPFSPGRPITPFNNVGGEPRATNFRVGQNVTARPRSDRVSFETLRQITSSYDVARICIQHRIDDVRSLDWRITNIPGQNDDRSAEIERARKAVAKPDGVTPFASWLHAYLEDVLRYDAGCLYRRRNRRGDVIGLEVVDGTTITPLLDYYGRKPAAPAPAYVQYANGVPWGWMSVEDLIYQPFRPQADSMYGMAPMEWLLINANTDIRFQWHFLKYFTEGNVPDGFMQAPPDFSSPDQVQEWQDAWDAFTTGDQAVKHQVKWVPNGAKFQAARDDKFDSGFPLFLMRKTCAAYGVVPNDLGFTDDVNRATGETQVEVQFRIGTTPLLSHVQTIINSFLQDDLGLEVQFRFDTGQEKDDRLEEAQAHDYYVKMGAESPDEVRENVLGLPVDPENITPRFVFSTRSGAIPLKSIMEIGGEMNLETAAPEDAPEQVETIGGQPIEPTGTIPNERDARTLTGGEGATESTTSPKPPSPTQAVEPSTPNPDEPAANVAKATDEVVAKWYSVSKDRVRKGMKPKRFNDVPEALADPIWALLRDARSREEVDAAFAVKASGTGPFAGTGEHGRLGDEVVAHYAPLILAALVALHPGAAAAAASIMESHPAEKATGPDQELLIAQAVEQFKLSVQADPDTVTGLGDLLTQIYADAYVTGARLADVHAGAAAASELGTFVPGTAAASELGTFVPGTAESVVADGGLGRLMANRGIVLRGITDTQIDRMGEALANGLRQGLAAHTVAADITAIIEDSARAELIAGTEMARAMGIAALDRYASLGVGQVEWLAEGDACPICLENMAQGPIPLGEVFSSGDASEPAHPNCRCATVPVSDSRSLAAFDEGS